MNSFWWMNSWELLGNSFKSKCNFFYRFSSFNTHFAASFFSDNLAIFSDWSIWIMLHTQHLMRHFVLFFSWQAIKGCKLFMRDMSQHKLMSGLQVYQMKRIMPFDVSIRAFHTMTSKSGVIPILIILLYSTMFLYNLSWYFQMSDTKSSFKAYLETSAINEKLYHKSCQVFRILKHIK